jgi:hypothetical protein
VKKKGSEVSKKLSKTYEKQKEVVLCTLQNTLKHCGSAR